MGGDPKNILINTSKPNILKSSYMTVKGKLATVIYPINRMKNKIYMVSINTKKLKIKNLLIITIHKLGI